MAECAVVGHRLLQMLFRAFLAHEYAVQVVVVFLFDNPEFGFHCVSFRRGKGARDKLGQRLGNVWLGICLRVLFKGKQSPKAKSRAHQGK